MANDEVKITVRVDDKTGAGISGVNDGFKKAKSAADGLNDALVRLARQEQNTAAMKAAEEKFKKLSEAEKAAMIAADDLAKSQDKVSQSSEKQKASITDLKSGIDLAVTGMVALADAAKQIYEIGRAGAELDYASVKFERLADRINVTSDLMLGKLRDATRGTLSDAELMASAGDLMSLRLAKSEDKLVRLSTVVAGLGMDMNELVLTMSNQTTRRFDQLGVSVEGFDDKVKALVETGMSAEDAFNEAFLQQAEEQLENVGNKADEAIGTFQRFEAMLKNNTNAAKQLVTEGIEPLLKAIVDADDAMKKGYGTVAGLGGYYGTLAVKQQEAAEAATTMTDAERRAREAAKKNADAVLDLSEAHEELEPAISNSAMVTWEAGQAAKAAADAYDEYWQRVKDVQQATKDLEAAQLDLSAAQASFREETGADFGGDLRREFEAGRLTAEEYEAALAAVDEVSGTHLLREHEMAEAQAELVKQFAAGKISVDEFKSGLDNFQDTWARFNEDIEEAQRRVAYFQDMLDRLEGTYTINIEVNSPSGGGIGTIENQLGQDLNGNGIIGARSGLDNFVVPPGYDETAGRPFLIATSSGESINVDPGGNRQSSNGGNTYNLTVRTEQGPRVVQRGFAIERALAGV